MLDMHEIDLVVQGDPSRVNGGRVAQHAQGAVHLGQVSIWYRSRRLVVDSDLESGRTPVDELERVTSQLIESVVLNQESGRFYRIF